MLFIVLLFISFWFLPSKLQLPCIILSSLYSSPQIWSFFFDLWGNDFSLCLAEYEDFSIIMRVIPLFQLVPCKCIWSENGFDVIMPSCRLAFWHSLYMDVWVDSKWEFSCEIFPLQGYNDHRWHICVVIAISFLQENSRTLQERPILGFFFFFSPWFYNVAEVTITHKMIKANLATK